MKTLKEIRDEALDNILDKNSEQDIGAIVNQLLVEFTTLYCITEFYEDMKSKDTEEELRIELEMDL